MEKKKFISELLWVFNVHYPVGSTVKEHSHRFHYQLLYVVSGSCTYIRNGERFTLQEGDCSLLPPGGMHGIESTESELTTYELKFLVDDHAMESALAQVPTVFKEDAFIHELISEIASMAHFHGSESHRISYSYHLGSLLCHIAAPYFKTDVLSGTSADSVKLAGMDFSKRDNLSAATVAAIDYIDAHYMEDVSLDEICDKISYNKSYLCYAFKKDTGKTVNEYFNYVRIKTAAEMIVFSDCTLAQICSRTGFKNISHFNRMFKKVIGITPGLYKHAFPEDSIIADLASLDLDKETRAELSNTVLLEFSKKIEN